MTILYKYIFNKFSLMLIALVLSASAISETYQLGDVAPRGARDGQLNAADLLILQNILDSASSLRVPNENILIVPDSQPQDSSSQKQLSWSRTGGTVTINLISPNGKLNDAQVKSSIVIPPDAYFLTTPTIISINYYDVNGVLVAGPEPTIKLVM